MDVIIGIDLGTTNSEVAIIDDGRPRVLEENGDPILPSVVGLDHDGRLLVGRAARNQLVMAPERTVRSIKRQMGQEVTVALGDQKFTPQEISAIILRTLKQRAEKALGHSVSKAVITVPAFFSEAQRDATREAGTLAGLDVVRIINEPTAAVLTYDPHPPEMERLLVYDLGGGTFDVSIAQVESGVVEILASHGDTQLGGDDFDQRLLDFVADKFLAEQGVDLRLAPRSRSRLLASVEEAKKRLSFEPVVALEEEFIAEKDGVPLNLRLEVSRYDYEGLIQSLLDKTLECVDKALTDAKLHAHHIHKVVLVGGATRTPLVQNLLSSRLGRPVHLEIEPDLAVAMGAAVQGGLIAGVDVGPVLVDITPHTLGLESLDDDPDGMQSSHVFAPIIHRNTPLPAMRTEIFTTTYDGQPSASVRVFQGEDPDTRYNNFVGEFMVEGLANVPAPNQIFVKLDLNLNGILKVTATERATGLERHVVIDNMMERFRKRHRVDAVERIDALFDGVSDETLDVTPSAPIHGDPDEPLTPRQVEAADSAWNDAARLASDMIAKACELEGAANQEDADELRAMIADLKAALGAHDREAVLRIVAEVEDLVFYLEDR